MYDECAKMATPESSVFSALSRIEQKIESLKKTLAPITLNQPPEMKDSENAKTELLGRLLLIDEKIANILDTVII